MYILQAKHLDKFYGKTKVIKDVSFSIKKDRYMDYWVLMEQEKVHLLR